MIIILFLIFLNLNSFAQDPHQYYPHQVGNLWQWVDDQGKLMTIKFERDSIDAFGNVFINTGPTPFPIFYWSWKFNANGDSAIYIPFASASVQYKFPLDSGNTWEVRTWLIAIVDSGFPIQIFGEPKEAFLISYYPDTLMTHWKWQEVFVHGIGQIWYGDEVSYRYLTGCIINGDTLGIITKVEDQENNMVNNFQLFQNYPNPFNLATTIDYEIKESSKVKLTVYDNLGREIAVLVNEDKSPGKYSVHFNGQNLASGVYIYKLTPGDNTSIRKMILLK